MRICSCGTVEDAIKVAERLVVDTTSLNCPVWTLQVASAFRTICVETVMVEEKVDRREVELFVNAIVKLTRKEMTDRELLVAAILHNRGCI